VRVPLFTQSIFGDAKFWLPTARPGVLLRQKGITFEIQRRDI
jgi:hypothetical protein